jgi:fumarate hydratase subunit beta
MNKILISPLTDDIIKELHVGDKVLIQCTIYTARDAAHKKLIELIDRKKELPFDMAGQILYYVGPTPAKPGKIIGSAGPTTSSRMDSYTPKLLELGLKATIGKGQRSQEVRESLKKFKALYLIATGGAAALISKHIIELKIIAFEELGPEAIHKLTVKDFPAIVANDIYGGDVFTEGIKKWQQTKFTS